MTSERPENPEAAMASFRAEVEWLKQNQPTADLMRVGTADLIADDCSMWQRVKAFETGSADLPRQEFDAYQEEANSSGNPSRRYFAASLCNRLFFARGLKELEREEKNL